MTYSNRKGYERTEITYEGIKEHEHPLKKN